MKKIILIMLSIISFSTHCAELIQQDEQRIKSILNKLTTYTQLQLFLTEVGKAQMENKEVTINNFLITNNDYTTLFDLKFDLNQYEEIMSAIENEISNEQAKIEDTAESHTHESNDNYHNEYNYYQVAQKNWTLYYQQINEIFKKNVKKWNNQNSLVEYLLKLLKIRTPLHRLTSQDYIQVLKNHSDSNNKYLTFKLPKK